MTISAQLDAGRREIVGPTVLGPWEPVDLATPSADHLAPGDRAALLDALATRDPEVIALTADGAADRAITPACARWARSVALRAGSRAERAIDLARAEGEHLDLSTIPEPQEGTVNDYSNLKDNWSRRFADPEQPTTTTAQRRVVVRDRWEPAREIGSDAEFERVVGERHGRVLRSGLGADRHGDADPERPVTGGAYVRPGTGGYMRHGAVNLAAEPKDDGDAEWLENVQGRYFA